MFPIRQERKAARKQKRAARKELKNKMKEAGCRGKGANKKSEECQELKRQMKALR